MRTILFLLVCISTLAQSPPATPQNLRLAATELSATTVGLTTIAGANNPLGIPHLGWAAYWQLPDNANTWIPEWTIDGGATWTQCGNQYSGGNGPGDWNYTETGGSWTYPYAVQMNQWLVRIRNVGPIAPLPAPNPNPGWSIFATLPPRSVRCPTCPQSMSVQLSSGITKSVSTPPLPLRTKQMRTSGFQPLILSAASVIDPDCQCPLFRVSFLAQTNRIYSFQRSHDLLNWELRPPEIDGDPGINAFYDVFEGGAMYRIVAREGVLPP
jgi:hypothetical protein